MWKTNLDITLLYVYPNFVSGKNYYKINAPTNAYVSRQHQSFINCNANTLMFAYRKKITLLCLYKKQYFTLSYQEKHFASLMLRGALSFLVLKEINRFYHAIGERTSLRSYKGEHFALFLLHLCKGKYFASFVSSESTSLRLCQVLIHWACVKR